MDQVHPPSIDVPIGPDDFVLDDRECGFVNVAFIVLG
jgi:hypothetical protein